MKRHAFNFVQKNGPAMGVFKFTDPALGGSGESSGFMTEEFAFNDRFRHGSTIDSHKRFLRTFAHLVQTASHQILSGTGLTQKQQVHIRIGNIFESQTQTFHDRGFTNDLTARLLIFNGSL